MRKLDWTGFNVEILCAWNLNAGIADWVPVAAFTEMWHVTHHLRRKLNGFSKNLGFLNSFTRKKGQSPIEGHECIRILMLYRWPVTSWQGYLNSRINRIREVWVVRGETAFSDNIYGVPAKSRLVHGNSTLSKVENEFMENRRRDDRPWQ